MTQRAETNDARFTVCLSPVPGGTFSDRVENAEPGENNNRTRPEVLMLGQISRRSLATIRSRTFRAIFGRANQMTRKARNTNWPCELGNCGHGRYTQFPFWDGIELPRVVVKRCARGISHASVTCALAESKPGAVSPKWEEGLSCLRWAHPVCGP